jgi:hypothetical protein
VSGRAPWALRLRAQQSYNCHTMPFARPWLVALVLPLAGAAAVPREHTVILGKWHKVKTVSDSGNLGQARVRQLIVDQQLKEYTSGLAHQVTDRLFVVRRAFQVNDALPQDRQKPPHWVWRLGGWISVDRITGRVAQLELPVFDVESSEASWYRDYAAYCGTSEGNGRAYFVVWQLGKRKPLMQEKTPGPGCAAPKWERGPIRVTFTCGGQKNSFIVDTNGTDEPGMNE